MSFLKEFKEFVHRGNAVELAVGVIFGGALGRVISSLVTDVLSPPLGLLLNGVDLKNLIWTVQSATAASPAVVISYGNFLQALIDFLIVSLAVFAVIKAINRLRRR